MAVVIFPSLRRVTFWLLWLFVFSLAWEPFLTVQSIGTISRLIGVLALVAGVLTMAAQGRIRRPSVVVCLAFVFVLANVLSLVWTVSFEESATRVLTYVQLFGLVWIVWEIVKRAEEAESLMLAYCLGAYVSIADSLERFARGLNWAGLDRFTGGNLNPNEFGAYLALGIPIAWFLFLTRSGLLRIAAGAYIPLAVLALLLTASRGAFLAGIVSLSVVPITASRQSLRSWLLAAILLLVSAGTASLMVPESVWQRLLTTGDQIREGSFGGRGAIWAAGLEAFQDRPLLGFGSGTFERAVNDRAAHNVFLAIAVEQGMVGLCIFLALLCASVWSIVGLKRPLRQVWAVIMLIWLVGSMSINWQYGKVTWWLLALLAVHSASQTKAFAHDYAQSRGFESPSNSIANSHEDVA